jgi:PIN domain nuclease of toxin-antitoxin system
MLNLDTHILVYALTGELTRKERLLLESDRWCISAIVLWELAMLAHKGRLQIDLDASEFQAALKRIQVWPLDFAICRQSVALDFRSDPADHLIAATSIVRQAPLVSRDVRILSSGMVPLAASGSRT